MIMVHNPTESKQYPISTFRRTRRLVEFQKSSNLKLLQKSIVTIFWRSWTIFRIVSIDCRSRLIGRTIRRERRALASPAKSIRICSLWKRVDEYRMLFFFGHKYSLYPLKFHLWSFNPTDPTSRISPKSESVNRNCDSFIMLRRAKLMTCTNSIVN